MLRWLLATVHLLAFGIGLGAIWVRARSLRAVPDPAAIARALRADAWWGIAALLWIGTGLPRLFLGTEKPTDYYLASHLFWLKMLLFLGVLLLEIGPAIALTRWRLAIRKREAPDTTRASRWAQVSRVEFALVLAMLLVATAVARTMVV
jgi:putative membrane protein